MSRTPRLSRAALLRTLSTLAASVVLLVLTALPALAAAGTKPDPDADPYLIGGLAELLPTAIVGVVVAVIAWTLLPSRKDVAAEDEHH